MFASMTAPPNMAPIAIMPVCTGAPLTVTLETLVEEEVVVLEVPFVGLPVVGLPVVDEVLVSPLDRVELLLEDEVVVPVTLVGLLVGWG